MYNLLRINNMTEEMCKKNYKPLASEIADLVNLNIDFSNNETYSQESIDKLKLNKTTDFILKMIERSFVICIYDQNTLIACGFLTQVDNRFFSKSLHVHPNFRGKGFAKLICNEREKFLRRLGIDVLYIESLKFQKTIDFHKLNGFKVERPYKKLENTILMKKIIR